MRGLHQNPRRGPAVSQLLMVGKPIPAKAGRYTVQLSITDSGAFRIETLSGGAVAQRVDSLTVSLADDGLARTIARVITVALRKQDATVDDARRAVVKHIDGELAFLLDSPSIQATNSAAYLQMVKGMFESAEDKQWADELAADMVAFHRALRGIGPATGDNRNNPSNAPAQSATAQPQTMADTVPTGTRRQVPPTMAGAHVAPLSEPLTRIIKVAHSNGGTVLRSKTANASQLRALARRGMAILNYRPGSSRPDPVSATLTDLGARVAVA